MAEERKMRFALSIVAEAGDALLREGLTDTQIKDMEDGKEAEGLTTAQKKFMFAVIMAKKMDQFDGTVEEFVRHEYKVAIENGMPPMPGASAIMAEGGDPTLN